MPEEIRTLKEIVSARFGERPAVILPDHAEGPTTLTYDELDLCVKSLARDLAGAGVSPGATALIVLSNGLEFLASFLALCRLGATALPVNPKNTPQEFEYAISAAGARFLIKAPEPGAVTEAKAHESVAVLNTRLARRTVSIELESASPSHPAAAPGAPSVPLFLYTSGTTSKPKGVPLSDGNLLASMRNFARAFALSPADRTLVVMPLFHVHGLIGATLSTLLTGGSIVLPSRFSASNFWSLATTYGITWYTAAPTIHKIVLDRADSDGAPDAGLRFIRSSSARLDPELITLMEKRLGTVVLESYGMTEAANQVSCNPLPPAERKAGSVGVPAGVAVSIIDPDGLSLPPGATGEVAVRGESIMTGYNANPEANSQAFVNGWFRTGDQGYLDPDGYLFINGRIKEIIIRGGENISPLEVDAVLARHPAVAEAVCFAVPDELYGEEVHAAVVLKAEGSAHEIMQFCARHLAAFKVPKKIHLTDSLPRTATNKVMRSLVARTFAGTAQDKS